MSEGKIDGYSPFGFKLLEERGESIMFLCLV